MYRSNKKSLGFTVVELAVVIVAIAILASIVIVAYNGIKEKALDASLKSDLDSASSTLEMDYKRLGSYPTTITAANNGGGLIATGNNVFTYNPKSYGYCLTVSNPRLSTTYQIKSSDPTKISTGTCTDTYTVSTFAGSGAQGFADGVATVAKFNGPDGLAVDASNNVYVADSFGHRVRKLDSTGTVSTYAGSGSFGYQNGSSASAQFQIPSGITVDSSGNVYLTDTYDHRVRKITPGGTVSTFAGTGTQGYAEGTGSSVQFSIPAGIIDDASGNLFIADSNNMRIRELTPLAVSSTFAGSATVGSADGTGATAQFSIPWGMAIDSSGNMYVSDYNNDAIRKITPAGVVTTLAGGTQGYADGTGAAAQFNQPKGVAVDSVGNVFVSDTYNNRIRKITPAGVVTTVAGSGVAGYAEGVGTAAQFNQPTGIAIDSKGNIYVSDYNNNRVRLITAQ
jgi:sugar lactone lactonase YvrE